MNKNKKHYFIFAFILFLLLLLCGCENNNNYMIDNRPSYAVSFITNCDMEVESMSIKEGDKLPFIPTLTKEGYTFISWDYDIHAAIYQDTIFEASWEENRYTIHYHLDEELENDNPTSIGYSESIGLKSLVKKGFIFEGWFLDTDFTSKIERIKKGTLNNIDLYPKFTEITFTIHYDLDGGVNSNQNPNRYSYTDSEIINLAEPTKDGYNFVGWYKEESFINLVTTINPSTASDVYLFARFTQESFATSTVRFNTNEGTLEATNQFDYSSPYATATINYYLVYDTQKGYNATLSDKLGNLYFYYICIKKTDLDNIYSIEQIVYLSTKVTCTDYDYVIAWHGSLKDEVTKASLDRVYTNRNDLLHGYVFVQNLPSEKTMEATINLTFYKKDAYDTSDTYHYTNPILLPTPTKDGYTFLGWISSIDGSTTSSYPGYYDSKTITYTAQWISDSFVGTDIQKAMEALNNSMLNVNEITEDLTLPTYLENCSITWKSLDYKIISDKGKLTAPYTTQEVTIVAIIKQGENSERVTYTFNVKGKYHDLSQGIKAGYFYYSDKAVSDYVFRNLDIMFMAFGVPTTDGDIGSKSSIGKQIYNNFVIKAHENGVRVALSINTKNCATVAASVELTNAFAKNCAEFVQTYELDGIDLDWEWPSSSEKTNFTRLAKTIREELDKINTNYLLTAAVGSYQSSRYDLTNSGKYLDYISIMTYDMQTSGTSSHNSALYYGASRGTYNIDKSLSNYSALISPSKIILGIPFYARYWTESTGPGTKASYGGAKSYSYVYTNYITKGKEFWDEECQVPYVYDEETGFFASYDNPKSIAIKAKYGYDKGTAGLMYWQGSQDHQDILVKAIVDEVNKNYK